MKSYQKVALSPLTLALSFEEATPLDQGQVDLIFQSIRTVEDSNIGSLDTFAVLIDTLEKELLKEEIDGGQIEQGEVEVNIGNVVNY